MSSIVSGHADMIQEETHTPPEVCVSSRQLSTCLHTLLGMSAHCSSRFNNRLL